MALCTLHTRGPSNFYIGDEVQNVNDLQSCRFLNNIGPTSLTIPTLKCLQPTSQFRTRAAPSLFCSSSNSKTSGLKNDGKRYFAGNSYVQMDSSSFRTCATAGVTGGTDPAKQSAPFSRGPTDSSENINGPNSTSAKWHEVLTPLAVARAGFLMLLLGAVLKLAWAVIFNTVFHPRLILYATWFLSIWPWPTAVALGLWSLAIATKAKSTRAAVWEQAVLVGGALTWLILVPCGHFQVISNPHILTSMLLIRTTLLHSPRHKDCSALAQQFPPSTSLVLPRSQIRTQFRQTLYRIIRLAACLLLLLTWHTKIQRIPK